MVYAVVTHVLLAEVCIIYFRIYCARSVVVDPAAYLMRYAQRSRGWVSMLRHACGPAALILPTPPPEWSGADAKEPFVFLADRSGKPVQCWRDRCKGHWRTPRMHHCGACGQCRLLLDHHCVWVRDSLTQFNNCLTVPDSIGPFLLFLLLVPVLIVYAEWPLFPTAWTHTRHLWTVARTDPSIAQDLLDHWWSWCLGPVPRYVVALLLGTHRRLAYTAHRTARQKDAHDGVPSDAAVSPSLKTPVCVTVGFLFSVFTLGMCPFFNGQVCCFLRSTTHGKENLRPKSSTSAESRSEHGMACAFLFMSKNLGYSYAYRPTALTASARN